MATSLVPFDVAILLGSAILGITSAYFFGVCPPENPHDPGILAMAILGWLSLSGPVVLLRRCKATGTFTIAGGEYAWCVMAVCTLFSLVLILVAKPHTLLWAFMAIWLFGLWPTCLVIAVISANFFHYTHHGLKPWSHWWGIALPLLQLIALAWLCAVPSLW